MKKTAQEPKVTENPLYHDIEIEFDEIRRYHIDKILDVRRAACQSVGGVGEIYLPHTGQGELSLV